MIFFFDPTILILILLMVIVGGGYIILSNISAIILAIVVFFIVLYGIYTIFIPEDSDPNISGGIVRILRGLIYITISFYITITSYLARVYCNTSCNLSHCALFKYGNIP